MDTNAEYRRNKGDVIKYIFGMAEHRGHKTQIWCARDEAVSLDLSKVKPVKYFYRKPFGGLWTSTYTPDETYCSDWIDWACREMPEWTTENCYILEPEDNVKVYEIDTAEDLENLYEKYPFRTPLRDLDVNWVGACRDYDAIHLTYNGQWATRHGTPKYGTSLNLYGWDVESTLWCKPKIKKAIPIEEIKDRKCKITCEED